VCDLNLRFVGKRRQDHESQGYCDKSEVNGAKVLNEILRPMGGGWWSCKRKTYRNDSEVQQEFGQDDGGRVLSNLSRTVPTEVIVLSSSAW